MVTSSDPFLGRLLAQRYRLTRLLGQGGMGRVYLGQDLLLDGVPVAVKLLFHPVLDESTRLRFEREAKACAALGQKSLHIVKVSDYGVTAEGGPFYVMEYLEGRTLRDMLALGAMPLRRFFHLARQIGLGLKAAHEGILLEGQRVQVIHRDLKPANVLVVPDESLGELAKLVDFGIAKLLNSRESLSMTHAYLGTLAYSSPEQLEGSPLDARSDIYSFGILLYQMVSGELPLQPGTDSFAGWYQAHHKQRPLPLEELRLSFPLPAGLSDLVLNCLAKDPAARPASMAEVLAKLEQVEAGWQGSPRSGGAVFYPSPEGLSSGASRQATGAMTGTLHLGLPTATSLKQEWRTPLWMRGAFFLLGGALGLAVVSWGLQPFLRSPSPPHFSQTGEEPQPEPLAADEEPLMGEAFSTDSTDLGSAELTEDTDLLVSARDPAPELQPYSDSGRVLRAFPLNTSRERVWASLGSPTQQGRGAWPNTVYDLYRLGEVNLGLVYEEPSLALRQTEATVAGDVPTPQVEGLLEDMLQSPLPEPLRQQLQAVREGRAEGVHFRAGSWTGLIQRTPQGHLYLGLWDPRLHSQASPTPAPPPLPVQPPPTPPPPRSAQVAPARQASPPAPNPAPGQALREQVRRARQLRGND